VRPLWRWRFDLGSPGTWRSVTPELARIDRHAAQRNVLREWHKRMQPRLFEQSSRRVVFVSVVERILLRQQGPADGEIGRVGVFGTGALFRFDLEEFVTQRICQSRHHLILQLEQVGDIFLEALGPEMRAGFCVGRYTTISIRSGISSPAKCTSCRFRRSRPSVTG
jgi:hypothetical protein